MWRHDLVGHQIQASPWWFASLPLDGRSGGRYDLASPLGTCYAATSGVGAVLEGLQMHLVNLPLVELSVRRHAVAWPPDDAPRAAKLTARALARRGVTAELWAGKNHERSQAWAAALRRDGWWVLYGGIRHDPSGRLRAIAIFDHEGEHPPTHAGAWPVDATTLHDDAALHRDLRGYGVHVRRAGVLPLVDVPEIVGD